MDVSHKERRSSGFQAVATPPGSLHSWLRPMAGHIRPSSRKGAGDAVVFLNCSPFRWHGPGLPPYFPWETGAIFVRYALMGNRRSCRRHRSTRFASGAAGFSVPASWRVHAAVRHRIVAIRRTCVNEAACLACMAASAGGVNHDCRLGVYLVKIVSTIQLNDGKYLCMRHKGRKISGPKIQEDPWNVRVQVGQRRLGH